MAPTDLKDLRRDIVAALRDERWPEALTGLERWCEVAPEDARPWLQRGYCLARLGRDREALAALDRAVQAAPGDERARRMREQVAARVAEDAATREVLADGPPPPSGSAASEQALTTPSLTRWSELSQPSSEAERVWSPGTVISGRYEIRDQAKGGMGVVYFAWDRELGRMVAVKTPLPAAIATDNGRARFIREAEAWIALGMHPNLCAAYYVQEIGGMPRLFVEYVDGGTLEDRVGQLSPAEGLDLAAQVAAALDYTHTFDWTDNEGRNQHGLVHRDVKPANVLLTSGGVAKLTDFGLVRTHGSEADDGASLATETASSPDGAADAVSGSWQTVTEAGGVVGTPPYMAPELWTPGSRATTASDVYAFGFLLYELLCGRRPFVSPPQVLRSRDRQEMLRWWLTAHHSLSPPAPSELVPGLEPELDRLLTACVAKRPGDRPQSFGELRSALVALWESREQRPYPRPSPQRTRMLADSLCNRAASFVALGHSGRAERTWKKALEIDPHHAEATANLALVDWQAGRITDVELRHRVEGLRAHHGAARVAGLAGRVELTLDDPVAAAGVLEPGLEIGHAEIRRDLGLALIGAARRSRNPAGPFARAAELLTSVLQERPADLTVVAALATAEAGLGRTEEAASLWRETREREPELPELADEALASWEPATRARSYVSTPEAVAAVVHLAGPRVACRTASGLLLVDLATRRVTGSIKLDAAPRRGHAVAPLAGGGELAVANGEAPITLFSTADGGRRRQLRPHPGQPICLAVSPATGTLVSGGSDRCVRLWDLETGGCLRTMPGHGAYVAAVAVSDDGRRIVSGAADGTLRIWDHASGEAVASASAPGGAIHAVAWVGERLVVTGSEDGAVRLWDPTSGGLLRTLLGHGEPVHAVLSLAGGGLIATAGGRTLRLWSSRDLQLRLVVRLGQAATDLVALPGGRHLAVAWGRGLEIVPLALAEPRRLPLALAHPRTSEELEERSGRFRSALGTARAALEEGRLREGLAALEEARQVPGYELDPEALELWGRTLSRFPRAGLRAVAELVPLDLPGATPTAVAVARQGRWAVAGDSGGEVWSWHGGDAESRRSLGRHGAAVTDVAASPTGAVLVSVDREGELRVWDLGSGFGPTVVPGRGGVETLAVLPGGKAVILATHDRSVRVRSLVREEPDREIGRHQEAVSALAVTADGRFVLAGGWDQRPALWSLDAGAEVRRFDGHEGAVAAVEVSPDGRWAASASDDGTVRVWDLATGRCRRVLAGHEGGATAVVATPDARFVVTGDRAGAVRLWEVGAGGCIRELDAHEGMVQSLALSPDGDQLLSLGADGALRRWFLDWEPELEAVTGWDDRARPFLEVFLRRSGGSEGGGPRWSEAELEALLADLSRRGFGSLERHQVERQLETLAATWSERRAEEEVTVRRQVAHQHRLQRTEAVAAAVAPVTRNLGLKVAAVAVALVVVVVVLLSFRSPADDRAIRNQDLWSAVLDEYYGRLEGVANGAWVASYQSRESRQQLAESEACAPQDVGRYLEIALDAERLAPPGTDPGSGGRDLEWPLEYRQAMVCVARLGGAEVVPALLRRAGTSLHPLRRHDLAGILAAIGEPGQRELIQALTSSTEEVRHVAAWALVTLHRAEGLAALREMLSSDRIAGNEAASFVLRELIVLGVIPPEEVFDVVRSLARSIDPRVRRNAINALILFERSGLVAELLEEARSDADPTVVRAAERTEQAMREVKLYEMFG